MYQWEINLYLIWTICCDYFFYTNNLICLQDSEVRTHATTENPKSGASSSTFISQRLTRQQKELFDLELVYSIITYPLVHVPTWYLSLGYISSARIYRNNYQGLTQVASIRRHNEWIHIEYEYTCSLLRLIVSVAYKQANAILLWKKNTVNWLISPDWNQQANRLIILSKRAEQPINQRSNQYPLRTCE